MASFKRRSSDRSRNSLIRFSFFGASSEAKSARVFSPRSPRRGTIVSARFLENLACDVRNSILSSRGFLVPPLLGSLGGPSEASAATSTRGSQSRWNSLEVIFPSPLTSSAFCDFMALRILRPRAASDSPTSSASSPSARRLSQHASRSTVPVSGSASLFQRLPAYSRSLTSSLIRRTIPSWSSRSGTATSSTSPELAPTGTRMVPFRPLLKLT
mmetsp:Transcript_30111/g.67503  ORF Transcript_30111/g.67503 Transcript_30111/m.67503 type:complete len:214 (-) Transcript_30111:423-1064(-)